MSRKDRYIRQHNDLRNIANEILEKISERNISIKATLKLLNKMAGQLRIHLKTEDDFLFPSLENSSDNKIKSLAESFDVKIHDLANEFKDYREKYNLARKVEKNLDIFKKDTKNILTKIATRMELEEKEIYTLI